MNFNEYEASGIYDNTHITQASTSSGLKRHHSTSSPKMCTMSSDRKPQPVASSDDVTDVKSAKKTKGRVKIKMEFIDNKLRRYTTFSKRKTGIMKKAYELSTLTGTQVMLLVASETGHVYTFATRKLQPMITSQSGKALIQTCLNSPDPPSSQAAATNNDQRMSATGYEETELTYAVTDDGTDKISLSEDYFDCNGSVSDSDGEIGSPSGSPCASASMGASTASHMPSGAVYSQNIQDNQLITNKTIPVDKTLTSPTLPVSTTHGQVFMVTTPGPNGQKVATFAPTGGNVLMNSSGGGLVYTTNGVVYAQQTSSNSNTPMLVKLEDCNNSHDTSNFSQVMAFPANLATTLQSAIPSHSLSANQAIPTDLSLPIKKDKR